MRPKLKIIIIAGIGFIIFAVGTLVSQTAPSTETELPDDYCKKDEQCQCGKSIRTGRCFIGNQQLVQPSGDCFEFCHQGVGMEIECVNNQCRRVYTGK